MRSRILTVALLAMAVAVTAFGVPLGLVLQRLILNSQMDQLEGQALRAALVVPADVGHTRDPMELPRPRAGTSITVFDAAGRFVAGDRRYATADPAVAQARRGGIVETATGQELVVAVAVTGGESVVAVVRSSSSRSLVLTRTVSAWTGLTGLALMACAAAYVLARRQAGRIARPLDQVRDTAEQLGGGNFAARYPHSGIPEIDRAGEALNATAARLERLIDRERSFAKHASHQLRTPLTGLRLALDAALSGREPRAHMERAVASVEELTSTVEDVLELSRSERTTGATTDLGDLLGDVSTRWDVLFGDAARGLAIDRPDGVQVRISRPALRQVLDVLLDNALRHGGGRVTIGVRESAGAVAVDVHDEGPARERGTAANDSNGIGLSLARRLLEVDGGRLLLRPQGGGTTATVLLVEADREADESVSAVD